jgi:glutaredoxin 3
MCFAPPWRKRHVPEVEVYTSPWCPYCWAVRRLLHRKGVTYTRIPIRMYLGVKLPTRNFRRMVERTGGDTTIPQIFVDGQYLGTDDTLFELEREGRLEERLGGGKPQTPE